MVSIPILATLVAFPLVISILLLQQWTLPLSTSSLQCLALQWTLGDTVSFPGNQFYEAFRQSYWSSQQRNLTPACVVRPHRTEDVATAMRIISRFTRFNKLVHFEQSPVAVKGGGHTAWEGASNVDLGITIDLGGMNSVIVNEAESVASVGGGAKWINVYETLDPLHLSVSGGRVADVGVAGLILGGGISFFSPQKGWACDQVANFEVVLANGQIVNANAAAYSDLWVALKGGSNNFGIVTRLDLTTFPQGNLWGGGNVLPIETRPQVFDAFYTVNKDIDRDKAASMLCCFVYGFQGAPWYIYDYLVYTKPEPYPEVLKPFTDLEPIQYSSLRRTNLSDLTRELGQGSPYGQRDLFLTATYGNDVALMSTIFDIANSTLQSIKDIPELVYSLVFQAVPSSVTSKSAEGASNVLGLDSREGPLVLVSMSLGWRDAADDAAIDVAVHSWLKQSDLEASKRGLTRPYIYLNYAHSTQKPIEGYGVANKRKLQEVSRKYDPDGFFQKVVVGGFKVFP